MQHVFICLAQRREHNETSQRNTMKRQEALDKSLKEIMTGCKEQFVTMRTVQHWHQTGYEAMEQLIPEDI